MDIYAKREKVSAMVAGVPVPRMFRARQKFSGPEIPEDQVAQVLRQQLAQPAQYEIREGMRVAVAVGSRGICNLPLIVRTVVEDLKAKGARPFIVPSMGSHGGATAQGQTQVLASLGITEEAAGCPILSSMETVCVGLNEAGKETLLDRHAAEADGIVLIARIKPHTAFRGRYESGLMKMMAIGLAKQKGAERTHNEGVGNLARNVYLNGKSVLQHCNVLYGVAIVENAFDRTGILQVVPGCRIEAEEPGLLKQAFACMPGILTGDCDVLVVDRVGKNISGEGMDPNISGRFILPEYARGGIRAQKVAILALTEETHGNCHGICNADVISQEVLNQADFEAFYINSITSTVLPLAKIPMVMANHRECIQVCLRSLVGTDPDRPKMVRIADTLHLEHLLLSEAYYDLVKEDPRLEIESDLFEMEFDRDGNLF